MRRRRLVGGLVAAVLGITAAAPVLVEAQNEEDRLSQVERQMAELERLIESAEVERTAYVELIEETEFRMEELRVQLWAAEDQLTSADAALAVSEDAFTGLSRRVRLMDAELAKTRLDQRVTAESLRERTVEMYMSSATGINSLFVGAWDPESNSIRLEYSRRLLEDTELLLHSLEILERQELTRQEELVGEREREAELLARLQEEQALAEQYRAQVASAREQLGEELTRQEGLLAEVIGRARDPPAPGPGRTGAGRAGLAGRRRPHFTIRVARPSHIRGSPPAHRNRPAGQHRGAHPCRRQRHGDPGGDLGRLRADRGGRPRRWPIEPLCPRIPHRGERGRGGASR